MTKEGLVKRQVGAYLKLRNIFFFTHDSVGIYDPTRKVFRKNNDPFRIPGASDFIGMLPSGRFLAIELKSETGRVSDKQKEFLNEVNQRGGVGFVARSVEDVKHLLDNVT